MCARVLRGVWVMPILDEQLGAWEKVTAEATEGPWEAGETTPGQGYPDRVFAKGAWRVAQCRAWVCHKDAVFIAAAREAMAVLLPEVRRLYNAEAALAEGAEIVAELLDEVKRLRADIERRENEEASVCPEDVGVVEYVTHLRAENERLGRERDQLCAEMEWLGKDYTRIKIERDEKAEKAKQLGIENQRQEVRLEHIKGMLDEIEAKGRSNREQTLGLMRHVQHCDEETDAEGMCMCARAISEALAAKEMELERLREALRPVVERWEGSKAAQERASDPMPMPILVGPEVCEHAAAVLQDLDENKD